MSAPMPAGVGLSGDGTVTLGGVNHPVSGSGDGFLGGAAGRLQLADGLARRRTGNGFPRQHHQRRHQLQRRRRHRHGHGKESVVRHRPRPPRLRARPLAVLRDGRRPLRQEHARRHAFDHRAVQLLATYWTWTAGAGIEARCGTAGAPNSNISMPASRTIGRGSPGTTDVSRARIPILCASVSTIISETGLRAKQNPPRANAAGFFVWRAGSGVGDLHVFEIARLVVDADARRRDPAGEFAGLELRLHQAFDEVLVRVVGQELAAPLASIRRRSACCRRRRRWILENSPMWRWKATCGSLISNGMPMLRDHLVPAADADIGSRRRSRRAAAC